MMIFMSMKKLMLILSLAMFVVVSASALDLWFAWTPNANSEAVTSYVIQQATGTSTNFIDVVTAPGTTNVWAVRGLGNGAYKFRLVAVNGAGRSQPSTVVSFPTNVPSAPANFSLTNAPTQ
jgi:predicted phage tail protein